MQVWWSKMEYLVFWISNDVYLSKTAFGFSPYLVLWKSWNLFLLDFKICVSLSGILNETVQPADSLWVAGGAVSGMTGAEMWIDGFLRLWQLPVGQCIPASQPCQRHDQRRGLTGGSDVGRLAPFVCIESPRRGQRCIQHYQGR